MAVSVKASRIVRSPTSLSAAKSKATYRSNFGNPAVRTLLQGKGVLDVARMDIEVKALLNKTLGSYSDDYRGNVRRIITGTLDECVRRGIIPRHTLSGIELAPRIVTAEQYEQQNKGMVSVSDDTVRMLAEGITAAGPDRNGRKRTRVMPGLNIAPWLQRTMGLRIREALGVRKSDFRARADGTPYMPYSTAGNRFGRMLDHLGISGVHTPPAPHRTGPGRKYPHSRRPASPAPLPATPERARSRPRRTAPTHLAGDKHSAL